MRISGFIQEAIVLRLTFNSVDPRQAMDEVNDFTEGMPIEDLAQI